jgi:biopolymer transport protein ExbB
MAAGLRKLPDGAPAAEQAIADQGATEVARMRRNLRLMHGIAAITPTLGLLGTVWGMIKAFEVASQLGLGSHSDKLTQGIYESLVATMTGLMIAVPVLIVYYVYLGIIDKAVLEMNDVTTGFIERHERAALIPRPAGAGSEGAGVNSGEPVGA